MVNQCLLGIRAARLAHLDDPPKVVAAFGVPKTMGFAKHQAYLFKDGKLVWRDLAAATEQQAADVLKVVAASSQ